MVLAIAESRFCITYHSSLYKKSLARAKEDRKEANKAAERLHEAAQAEWPYVPPPAVHHLEFAQLKFEEDFVDMGTWSEYLVNKETWSKEDSVQFCKKKQHRLEFIMAVVLCTEAIAAMALKGMLRSRNDDAKSCGEVVDHAMLVMLYEKVELKTHLINGFSSRGFCHIFRSRLTPVP